jgi:hypothetical protein
MDKALQEVVDKQAITDLLHRYCRSMDRCDYELGYSLWHDGSVADYGAQIYQGPGRGFIDYVLERHLNYCLYHSHQITAINMTVEGDHAGSEAYVWAVVRTNREGTEMQRSVWGRYIDSWERRGGRWGIVKRTYIHDFDDIREAQPMQAGWGKRDRSDPSYAVLETAGRETVAA